MKRIVLLISIIMLASCSNGQQESQGKNPSQANKSAGKQPEISAKKRGGGKFQAEKSKINVESDSVITGEAVSVFNTTTILEADLESAVTSKSSGIVLQINAEVGDAVEEGDVLAILESDVQELQLKSAEANYQKSLHNYERAKTLLGKGLANQESVDNLKFETKALKTKLEEAQLDLDFTRLQAPISGIITSRNIKKGNLIQLNTEVYHIVDFDSIQAIVNIPENKWQYIKPDLEVRLRFAGISEMIMGNILRVDPVIDSTTGTFSATVQIHDKDIKKLRPGLFGKTEIILDKHEDVLLVSKNALIREDNNAYVYVINEDHSVTKTAVTIGYEMQDNVEIVSGLSAGLQVVTTGKNNISEGSLVEVIKYND